MKPKRVYIDYLTDMVNSAENKSDRSKKLWHQQLF